MKALRVASTLAVVVSAVCTARADEQTVAAAEPIKVQSLLEEVVVTSQRRSERLVDVPLSITVVDAGLLGRSGVGNTRDLERLVPGYNLVYFGGQAQPVIRGISSTGSGVGDQSNVATYIDGVYQPSQSNQMYDLSDIESIEVLKGPQGSLYGQNAAGGAIIIKTLSPSFEPTGKLSVSYGRYDDIEARGFISGPLSPTVAVSLSGKYQERDGYNHNLVTGSNDGGLESKLLRGKLLWRPADGTEILFGAYWFDLADTSLYAAQPHNGNATAYLFNPAAPVPSRPWEIAYNVAYNDAAWSHEPSTTPTGYGASLQATFNTAAGEWRFISAYSNAKPGHRLDFDYTAVPWTTMHFRVLTKAITQEVTFASRQLGNWRYTAGLFYLNSKEHYPGGGTHLKFFAPFPNTAASHRQKETTTRNAAAAFGEVEYTFNPQWSVIAGLRTSYETNLSSYAKYPDTAAPLPEQVHPDGTFSFQKTTPRVSVRYEINDRNNVYATFSKGFKSGIVDVQNYPLPPADSENITAYEIGYKGTLLDRLQINAAAFRYEYEDMQVQMATAIVGQYFYQNAASSRIDGFEAGLQVAATEHLDLGLSFSYMDGKYESFPNAYLVVPNPATGGRGNIPVATDVSGNDLIRTPKWTGQVSGTYSREIGWGTVSLSSGLYHNDGFSWEPGNRVKENGYTLWDAELAFAPRDSGFSIALWGRNLTDEAVQMGYFGTPLGDFISYRAPRAYGVRMDYQF